MGHLAENCDEKRVAGNLPVSTSGGEFNLEIKNLKIVSPVCRRAGVQHPLIQSITGFIMKSKLQSSRPTSCGKDSGKVQFLIFCLAPRLFFSFFC